MTLRRVSRVAFPIVWAIGLLVFAWIIAGRSRLLLAAQPAARFDRIGDRLRRAVVYGLGQKKFLAGEQPAGIMHALIFWGFAVLMIQVVLLFGRTFDASWDIPGFAADQPLGPPFFLARDVLEVVVIAAAVYMLYRRLIAHTPRLFAIRGAEQRYRDAPHWEGVMILFFILLIMVGGLLYDAGHLVADDIGGSERDFAPVTALAASVEVVAKVPHGAGRDRHAAEAVTRRHDRTVGLLLVDGLLARHVGMRQIGGPVRLEPPGLRSTPWRREPGSTSHPPR